MAKIIIITDLDPRESVGAVTALLDKVFAGNQCPLAGRGNIGMMEISPISLSSKDIPDDVREILNRFLRPRPDQPPKAKPPK